MGGEEVFFYLCLRSLSLPAAPPRTFSSWLRAMEASVAACWPGAFSPYLASFVSAAAEGVGADERK